MYIYMYIYMMYSHITDVHHVPSVSIMFPFIFIDFPLDFPWDFQKLPM